MRGISVLIKTAAGEPADAAKRRIEQRRES